MTTLQVPTVPLAESRLRIFQDAVYILNLEINRLGARLKCGHITQEAYQDTVAAIEHDIAHLNTQIESLTTFSPQEKEAA